VGASLTSLSAQSTSDSTTTEKGFAPIIVRVMNRGTNILMTSSFVFIMIYSIYVAIGVSFGSIEASTFVNIFWGSGIAFAGGALAKIYYTFLS
ncbi:MAG: hypothetical protein V4507_01465, partial [Verrucomicrobiota bacterium]